MELPIELQVDLPDEFVQRMKSDLGSDFLPFINTYANSPVYSLRFNPLKMYSKLAYDKVIEEYTTKEKVNWCETGYYSEPELAPGSSAYHHSGLIYIQEASAMSAVEKLDVQKGMKVLDMCAAPGGKSTQIAGKLMGEGLLVCNEPVPNRAKILSENIERLGVKNAIVTNEYPDKLAKYLQGFFDRILIDAPCSGEGMFRKNPDSCNEWSEGEVRLCADRDDDLLDMAVSMLAEGGKIVFSTCTFARAEDEESLIRFIQRHPDFEIEYEHKIFPHEERGEGHFVGVLKHKAIDTAVKTNDRNFKNSAGALDKTYCKFLDDTFVAEVADGYKDKSRIYQLEDRIYFLPEACFDFKKLHVLRVGMHMGNLLKGRFEPSHALGIATRPDEVKSHVDYEANDQQMEEYLKGSTLSVAPDNKGWTIVCVDGVSLGWGKAVNGTLKNHYPKGLRK